MSLLEFVWCAASFVFVVLNPFEVDAVIDGEETGGHWLWSSFLLGKMDLGTVRGIEEWVLSGIEAWCDSVFVTVVVLLGTRGRCGGVSLATVVLAKSGLDRSPTSHCFWQRTICLLDAIYEGLMLVRVTISRLQHFGCICKMVREMIVHVEGRVYRG